MAAKIIRSLTASGLAAWALLLCAATLATAVDVTAAKGAADNLPMTAERAARKLVTLGSMPTAPTENSRALLAAPPAGKPEDKGTGAKGMVVDALGKMACMACKSKCEKDKKGTAQTSEGKPLTATCSGKKDTMLNCFCAYRKRNANKLQGSKP